APVTDLVAEPFDDDRAVVGQVAGGLALLAQVGDEVVRGPRVQAVGDETGPRVVLAQRAHLAHPRAERTAEPGGPPGRVALPERQATRQPGGGGDEDAVGGDLLDAPRGRAEREGVADARLVDHLLVELPDAPPAPAPRAPVRRRALRARAGEEHAV